MNEPAEPPLISVVVLNYNGRRWIERCLESLRNQTLFGKVEVIVADNRSNDGSDHLAEGLLAGWTNGRFVQNGANLGFSEGNNRAARVARGRFLFFLNNDTWLEPDCLEQLADGVASAEAQAATPQVLNYGDDSFQSMGALGFDLFGLSCSRLPRKDTCDVLMPEGCSFLIDRELFGRLGGFDPEFFMYAEEYDLAWRVWLSGHKAVAVPGARLHHWGGAQVNPAGGGQPVEFRTSDTKRFYANRNGLIVVLKNARHLLLAAVPLQLILFAAEFLAGLVLIRRWSYVKRAYWDAVADCWRLRRHILAERRRIRGLRRRGDLWMLRFLRWRLNRWDEVLRVRRMGLPKITAA